MTLKNRVYVMENIDLAAYSSFGISSNASELITVNNTTDLLSILGRFKRNSQTYRIMGGGSNLVLPDEGVGEPIIRIYGGNLMEEETSFVSNAGVLLSNLVEKSISMNLSGLELLSGIPGTIAGAVVGNAGAYGKSISDAVEWVEVWNGEKVATLSKNECFFSYRNSIFKQRQLVILRVKINLTRNQDKDLKSISKKIINLRTEKYHPGIKCPGSFFKNIPLENTDKELLSKIDHTHIKGGKIPAGYLLEEVNARGMRVGDIQVADFHGNLLINLGEGKSSEVRKLADLLKEKVNNKFGVILDEEVRYF